MAETGSLFILTNDLDKWASMFVSSKLFDLF